MNQSDNHSNKHSKKSTTLSPVNVNKIASTLHLEKQIINLENQLSEHERFILHEAEVNKDSLSDAICLALYDAPYNSDDDIYSETQIDEINLYKLFFTGIGNNFFFMNECDGWRDIATCLTLADYCKQQHEIQQRLRFEREDAFTKTDYKFNCSYWVRFIQQNNTLCYANVHSADSELYWILEEILNDFIDEVVPHQWVEGKNNNKEDENGFIEWDMHIDANGYEALYDFLLMQGKLLINQQVSNIANELAQQPPITMSVLSDDNNDTKSLTIVVNNQQAAEAIYFRDFTSTVDALKQSKDELTNLFKTQQGLFKQSLLKLFHECELPKPRVT
jgi:hypothetical protein